MDSPVTDSLPGALVDLDETRWPALLEAALLLAIVPRINDPLEFVRRTRITVMMAWFPSDLVPCWLTNTLLSIAQQWNIDRAVEREAREDG